MPRLTIQNGPEKNRVLLIRGQRATIGRSVNNDIPVVDRRMSRSHVELHVHDDGTYARDLSSKNGTLLNGVRINLNVRVHSGDILQVGDTKLLFESDTRSAGGADPHDSRGQEDSYSSEMSSAYRLVDEQQWGSTQGKMRAGASPSDLAGIDRESRADASQSQHRLGIIYKVTEAIRSILDVEELLNTILNIVQDVLDPDRAYLLLRIEENGPLVPQIVRTRDREELEPEIAVSRSIVNRCMEEGVSLLVSDAMLDDRFAASESVVAHRIRTAMAAPLIYRGEAMGVVYVDTRTREKPYTQEELELLTGITNQAALAIVNARLHGQMVEQHKMAREMEIARTIQMNLLPKYYPDLPGFDVSAMSLPAKQVGGDYYDFIDLPDGRTCMAIADVSGKGVPAAILTAITRSYLQSETRRPGVTLSESIRQLNHMIHRDVTDEMYVTMFMLYLDSERGEAEYVNAGHTHPILIRRDGSMLFLDKGGVFLGIDEDSKYDTGVVKFSHGDVLALQTDGVTDLLDPEGKDFGFQRLRDTLSGERHRAAEEIRNTVYQDCQKHRDGADQFDDFTLIVLKRVLKTDTSFEDFDLD
jgi:serine phosphatase RsbU (regulator of sigma subunit)